MYFLDLATQGVRGFSHNARVALTPGYVVLHPSGTEGVPLSALALALLYPEGRGSDGALAAPGAKVGKAALTLLGNDVVTYRVVRELGGSGVLQWLNKTTQRFEVVTQDVAEANQFLRSPVGAPTRATVAKPQAGGEGRPGQKAPTAPSPSQRRGISGRGRGGTKAARALERIGALA